MHVTIESNVNAPADSSPSHKEDHDSNSAAPAIVRAIAAVAAMVAVAVAAASRKMHNLTSGRLAAAAPTM